MEHPKYRGWSPQKKAEKADKVYCAIESLDRKIRNDQRKLESLKRDLQFLSGQSL